MRGLFRFLYTLEVPRIGGSPAQAGALCWRRGRDGIEVLLISGRRSGRWGLPAGWALRGRSLVRTAEREAWEEAGVRGRAHKRLLGLVPHRKRYRLAGPIDWQLAIYSLEVEHLADDYPEAAERDRQWLPLREAAGLVHPSALAPLLLAFAPD